MGLKYVVTKQVFAFDETQSEKFVVKQVSSGKVSFSKLCTQVGQICGAHRGTVQLVIAGLVDVLINNIEDGKSVQLGEFGTFRPAINAKAADTEEEANATTIYRKTVRFSPGTGLKNTLSNASVTRYVTPDTDYTVKGKESGNNGGDDDGGYVDPDA